MQRNYCSRYLVTIDNKQSRVNLYENERSKFEEVFLLLKACKRFVGKSRTCRMTEMSGVCDSSDFDLKTFLIGSDDNEYILISAVEIIKFSTEDKILGFLFLMGDDMTPTAIFNEEKYKYFIFDY